MSNQYQAQEVIHLGFKHPKKYLMILTMLIFIPFLFGADGFQHQTTGFSLQGSHESLTCLSCHSRAERNVYTGEHGECATCHLGDYNNSDHSTRIFLISDCTRCHTTTTWSDTQFDHGQSDTQCAVCHLTENLSANEIVTGHTTLANTCTTCHASSAWSDVLYLHQNADRAGNIPMNADCSACHVNGFRNMEANDE